MRASAAALSASKRSTIDRRRVRRAREAEAVRILDAQAVDADDVGRAGKLRGRRRAWRSSACCSPSAQATLSSGVDTASGSASSTADGSAWRDRISSSRAPAYRPSSKPYQRSLEERVAAHLAGERRADFLHLALDQRVAGLPQQRHAAVAQDPRLQVARRLDVVDDRRAGLARQHVGGEQHQLPVGVDDVAVARHDAQAVAVAVEREAELAVASARAARSGRAGSRAATGPDGGSGNVPSTSQKSSVTSQPRRRIQRRREGAGDAVAAVDGDLHRPRELDVADDAVEVRRRDVVRAVACPRRCARRPASMRARSAWMSSPDSVSPSTTILRPL